MTGAPEPAGRREESAGGVVIHRDVGGVRYLLIRDAHRNWGFPKGHVEPGETPEGAAVREVREETGLSELEIRAPLAPIAWWFHWRGERVHKTCHLYLMESAQAATTPQLDEGITACRWTTFDEAQTLVSYANARGALRAAHALLSLGDEAGRA